MMKSHDLTGQVFGSGTVIRQMPKPEHLQRGGLYWLVECSCGQSRIVDTTTLKSRWTNCGCIQEENLVGKRFHQGVIEASTGSDGKGHRLWRVLCDCGNTYTAATESLVSGNTKSCGCRNRRLGKEHPFYKGHEDLSGDYWNKLKRGARVRDIDFKVTIDLAWKLFERQDKKCALTGWPITLSSSPKKEQTASLDRINSSGSYTEDNIQWVHKDVNRIKQHYSQEYLFSLCEAITKNRKRGSH